MKALYRELDASHGMVDGDLGKRNDRERADRVQQALVEPEACLFVVRARVAVIGFIMATFLPRGRDVVIEALMVHQDYRRRGVGTALMRAAENWAVERGVRFIELNVYEFNPEARAFYESLGYLTAERRMRRDPKFDVQRLVRKEHG